MCCHYLNNSTKCKLLENLKSANSQLVLILYRQASKQLFYLVFISDIIYIRSNQDRKVRNLFTYVFTMSLPNGVHLAQLCMRQTVLVYLIYCSDVHIDNNLSKRYRMPFKQKYLKSNNKMSLPQRTHNDI